MNISKDNMMLKNTAQKNVYPFTSAEKHIHISPINKAKLTLLLIHESERQLQQWIDIFDGQFSIKTATNGLEALKTILDDKIDLILSAVQLTSISGLDVCKFVKRNSSTAHIQIALVSEDYSELEEEQALASGAIDYILSDTQPNILFIRVKNQMKVIKHNKDLEHVSKTDALTGIANRMWFDKELKKEWQSTIRGEGEISIIMIDIDHFKLYNDEFGHVKGDECLRRVAQCLEATKKRSKDLLARFGGEEFVVLLPFTNLEGAKKIAAELVDSINKLKIAHAPKADHPNITISAGIASYSPTFDDKTNFGVKNFVERADIKLYQAKKYGRNKYCY
jgi:diguanylate cyclase (GGDEF)-like protein